MQTSENHAVTIRAAVPADQIALLEVMRRASLANPGDREALLANPDAFELPVEQLDAATACVAVRDGLPVGFAVVLRREDGDAELDGLFVEPALWRIGAGRMLVERARELALDLGAGALHVIANPHADGFYRSVGFEPSGTFQTRFGVGTVMRLGL
ncbi:GNAT family N-acetyltransferase [Devosia sp.]|uniref:GNAT family N-acetyltransferase n=1 Tax=Devosia sp. TaxID=1871048 RepID=UPI003BA8FFBB